MGLLVRDLRGVQPAKGVSEVLGFQLLRLALVPRRAVIAD